MLDTILLHDRLRLDPARGAFDFVFRAHPLLQDATACLTYRDARGNAHFLSLAGDRVAYGIAENRVTMSRSDGAVELVWNGKLDDESYLWLEVVNRSREPIHLDELRVLSLDAEHGARVNLDAPPRQWRFFQNGWQSWSAAFARAADNGVHADPNTDEYRVQHQPHAIPTAPKTLASEWFAVLTDGGRTTEDRKNPSSVLCLCSWVLSLPRINSPRFACS